MRGKLSLDQAVAEFHIAMRAHVGPERLERASPAPFKTREEIDAFRYGFAERLIRRACPDAGTCVQHRCRRARRCRHLADLDARRKGRQDEREGRPPSAHALRHAIWIFMNACRADCPE
jgi:hypothetical protein